MQTSGNITVTGTNTEDVLDAYRKAVGSKSTCPSCGYCPHCGRGGHQAAPYYPMYPQPTSPWWVNPYQPQWGGGTQIFCNS